MSEHQESSDLRKYVPHKFLPSRIDPSVYLAPGSYVGGDVWIGEESSVWMNAVVRGDVNFIRIGARSNVQDNSIIHVSHKGSPTHVGNDVTVGHGVILHACTVNDFALVGMGSVVLDDEVIGEYVLLGAGSLVTQNTKLAPYTLAFGRPAKSIRELKPEEVEHLKWSAGHYVKLSRAYLLDK